MNRFRWLSLGVVALSAFVVARRYGAPQPTVVKGTIQISELSGATCLRDGTLVMASDEDSKVYTLRNLGQLYQKKIGVGNDLHLSPLTDRFGKNGDSFLDDIEDIAVTYQGNEGAVYFVTSSSRNKKGKGRSKKPERFRIGIAPIRGGKLTETLKVDAVEPEIGSPDELKDYDLDLKGSLKRTPAQGGFNIEGATFRDSHLLLGLRSPTATFSGDREVSNEDAVVLEIDHPLNTDSWSTAHAIPLNLEGAGIRGLCYDDKAKGTWILGGVSPDVADTLTKRTWSLWFWPDGGAAPIPKIKLGETLGLTNAEAICLIPAVGSKPRSLFIAEDMVLKGQRWTGYLLVPIIGGSQVSTKL